MPKIYSTGDNVPAADLNGVVKVAGGYAASSGGSDTYAITVTPIPGSYAAGDVFYFKADVANTGAASLNVNSLGAKTIKKWVGTALADLDDGDIQANQLVGVQYDGTYLVLFTRSNENIYVTASNNQKVAADTERSSNTTSGNYSKIKEIRVMVNGKIRCSWDLKTDSGGNGVNSKIYVNDLAVGTVKSSTSTSYATQTDDISVRAGDLVQLYGGLTGSGYNCYVRNFRINYDKAVVAESTVITD